MCSQGLSAQFVTHWQEYQEYRAPDERVFLAMHTCPERGKRCWFMLRVRTSSQSAVLRQALLESVAEKLARGVCVAILTPNKFVERWLEEFLANELGILHNVRFSRTESSILERLARISDALAASTVDARIGALFSRYQMLEAEHEVDRLPVRYLRALPTREQRMAFCIALGRSLHFHFLEGWPHAIDAGHPLYWQRELARSLQKDLGIYAELGEVAHMPPTHDDRAGTEADHLMLFAPSPMPRALLECLTTTAFANANAEMYLWTPSEGPWERERAEHISTSTSNRLLSRWGLAGHDFVHAAWSYSQVETLASSSVVGANDALFRLQRGVVENSHGHDPAHDESLQVMVFESAEDEVAAVLQDIRQRASDLNSSTHARDFLIVLAESARAEYLPLLHGAFEQHNVPWVGFGLGTQTSSAWLDAVIKIFSFPVAGLVTRQNVLAIVMHECVCTHEKGGSEFARATVESGVLFGVEQRELENTYLEDAHTTWDAGLTHMFSEGDLDASRFPMDRDVRGAAMTARLLLSMREEMRSAQRSARAWCESLRDWTTLFLGPEVARNLSASWLSLLAYDGTVLLHYDEIFALWSQTLERLSGLSRGTDPRGISVVSLQAGIGYGVRHTYCLGFSENATRKSSVRALDPTGLIGHTLEWRDRYSLLTLLMTTRSSFWMSSAAQSEDGAAMLPSRYFEDLCRALGASHAQAAPPRLQEPVMPQIAANDFVIANAPRDHEPSGARQLPWSDVLAFVACPLQGSVRHHTERRALGNVEEHEVLEAIALSSSERRRWLTESLAQLLRGANDDVATIYETLRATAVRYAERNNFPRGALMREAVLEVQASVITWLRCLRRIDDRQRQRNARPFVLGSSAIPSTLVRASSRTATHAEDIQVHGRVACLDGETCRELIAVAADSRQAHQNPKRQQQEQDLWARRETWLAAATHIALTAAHGQSCTRVFTLLHLNGSVSRTQLRALDVGAAQSWLAHIAHDLLFAQPSYVAPIEAILLYAKQLRDAQDFDGPRAVREYLRFHTTIARSWAWGSSRWGPVEDYALYPAPAGTALEELLLLRYAPLFGVQGESVPITPEKRESLVQERPS